MCDLTNFLLFLLFVILCCLFYEYLVSIFTTTLILGGNNKCDHNTIIGKYPLYFDDYIIDGSNMIYSLYHAIKRKSSYISPEDYILYTKRISMILRSALPDKNIHIILKNAEHDKTSNDKNKSQLLSYQSIKNIYNMSKIFKNINYHVAFDTSGKNNKHTDLARDDILSILLSKQFSEKFTSICLITNDKLKDHPQFKNTLPFMYYSIKNGVIVNHGQVNPQEISHNPANNKFEYTFYSNNEENHPDINGGVYEHNNGSKCLYLKYYHINK